MPAMQWSMYSPVKAKKLEETKEAEHLEVFVHFGENAILKVCTADSKSHQASRHEMHITELWTI